jgi:hypothetical protein
LAIGETQDVFTWSLVPSNVGTITPGGTNGNSPTITWTSQSPPGSPFTVTVTATSPCNSTPRTASINNIVVGNPPLNLGPITGATSLYCGSNSPYSVTVTNATSSNNLNYVSWSSSAGQTYNNGGTSQSFTFNSAINSPYSLQANAHNGYCYGPPSTLSITVNPIANPGRITGPTSVCLNGNYIYSISSVPGATTYQWSSLGVPYSGLLTNRQGFNFPIPGSNYVSVVAKNGLCSSQASSTIPVNVGTTTTPIISVSPLASICLGANTTLTATGGSTYSWSPSSGLSAITGSTVTASPSVTTTYNVIGRDNVSGCSSFQPVVVFINPTPSLNSTLFPSAICSSSTFTYTPTSATASSTFAWSRATVTGISQSASSGIGNINEVLTNTTNAAINVTYAIITTANGCSSSQQNMVVSVNPTPLLSSTHSPTALCSGSTFAYTPTSAVASTTFYWSRFAVTGISQSGSDGTGNISETRTNTTNAQINVI